MSQQQSSAKPSLQGVRIKERKRAVKASAKHEPAVFRDQLYKFLETVPGDDFDATASKLIQAGSSLDFTKYAEPLFEILFLGGLLQSGGTFVDDGAPPSPFAIVNAKEPAELDDVKRYVEVLNKVIRRYLFVMVVEAFISDCG